MNGRKYKLTSEDIALIEQIKNEREMRRAELQMIRRELSEITDKKLAIKFGVPVFVIYRI